MIDFTKMRMIEEQVLVKEVGKVGKICSEDWDSAIPDKTKEAPLGVGEVVAIGPGYYSGETGKVGQPNDLEPGDIVYFEGERSTIGFNGDSGVYVRLWPYNILCFYKGKEVLKAKRHGGEEPPAEEKEKIFKT